MRLAIFLVSSLSVCGFYLYVLAQLYWEEKRQRSRKNGSQAPWNEAGPEKRGTAPKRIARIGDTGIGFSKHGTGKDYERPRFHSAATVALDSKAEVKGWRVTVISLVLGVGGLAALFAGIELFNSLVTGTH
jgi:hypothetical protein